MNPDENENKIQFFGSPQPSVCSTPPLPVGAPGVGIEPTHPLQILGPPPLEGSGLGAGRQTTPAALFPDGTENSVEAGRGLGINLPGCAAGADGSEGNGRSYARHSPEGWWSPQHGSRCLIPQPSACEISFQTFAGVDFSASMVGFSLVPQFANELPHQVG